MPNRVETVARVTLSPRQRARTLFAFAIATIVAVATPFSPRAPHASRALAYSPVLVDGQVPAPVDDGNMRSFIGDWTGLTDVPGNRVQEVESVEWTLNHQFVVFHAKSLTGTSGFERTAYLSRDSSTNDYRLTVLDGSGCVATLRGPCEAETFRFEGDSCLGRMTLVIERENPDRYRIRTSYVDARGDTVNLPMVERQRLRTPYLGTKE